MQSDSGDNVAKQHQLLVCRMTLETKKRNITKAEPRLKWWKLKKEDCCEEFREEIRRALGGKEELPDDWTTTANIVKDTAIKDIYDDSATAVRCAVGVTEGFEVKVGLHQGSALSPCLFAMVMDGMTDEIREEAPWTMMFADDIVICSESNEQVEERLESWIYAFALEIRGLKVNRRKTEYMCVNER